MLLRRQSRRPSKPEPALARALGERTHTAVVPVAAAVEHAGLDARVLRPPGQHFAGALCLVHRIELLELGLRPRDRHNGPCRVVVDELGKDAAVRAEHRQAGPLRAPANLRPHAAAPAEPALWLRPDAHALLPTFRRTCSPS